MAGWRWSRRSRGRARCSACGCRSRFRWAAPVCSFPRVGRGSGGRWPRCLRGTSGCCVSEEEEKSRRSKEKKEKKVHLFLEGHTACVYSVCTMQKHCTAFVQHQCSEMDKRNKVTMSHAQTYQMKWPDQLSQVKEKAQHSNVSQERKTMAFKVIMTSQKQNTTHALSRSMTTV